jgi:hypothetical protein
VLVGESPLLVSLKNWKMTYRRTTDYVASSLDFLFTNQYSLGGGVFVFNSVGALVQVIFCVTLLSNLIYLALQELMSLRDHVITRFVSKQK